MIPLPERLLQALNGWDERPQVVGLCGAQGSGKSTLAAALKTRLEGQGQCAAVLSLDDLYLPPEQRPVGVHPLFATRGPPGTHDVDLGIRVLDTLKAGGSVRLPRFDKSRDRPFAEADWPVAAAPDIIIFEGWCVGAVPQPDADLMEPVNTLERERDPDGVWRRYVNAQLARSYSALFGRIDRLVLLAAPRFEVVQAWRTQQERDLSRMLAHEGRAGTNLMSDAEVARFIQHYERLTRYILGEMPGRADLTIRLGPDRTPLERFPI